MILIPHTKPQSIPEDDYIDRLLLQAKETACLCFDRPIQSIFIGGGTRPNLTDGYKRLLSTLNQIFDLKMILKIMEANPGTRAA